ncbi:methionyl-tRNA formyltransferase [Aureimonas phyllosphaerae]|uniref:Methionyl-tRNA formyltransferase n=1 Tax=Aureimonas phyllosphaerae TaxID=1166078 RepID=A0A7W6BZE4_9HYPH|nr:formyltransferase family protein [Aureimonas phyllosphaerae]MBB3937555.1 methionyl-tRNA formyltransferase [Aureimonas phyllosphaerae]MBB3961645.1 methionyl-tRNA formyltransferase [Aureimonas phyllosphaerae]SFF46397.1 methionyl-tRNA formyltransferase [Aureimonas phyllosphaerae]
MSSIRTVFVGAVEGSLVALEALIAAGRAPVLVVTLPPESAHRHSDYVDLARPARKTGAAVHFTTNINAPETVEAIRAAAPDLTMVIGWSQICREPFRSVARLGTLGYHPSPLPRFRGRAVIPWTILAEETTSGSSVFWLDEGVDSGPIIVQRLFPVAHDETARSLYDKHKQALAEIAVDALDRIARGEAAGTAQDERLASYCAKRTEADGLIDWREPSEAILRLVRAVGDPYPGAFTFDAGDRIVVGSACALAPHGRHIGLTGQVQGHTERGFSVLCGDGITIEVTTWRGSPDGRRPKVHARLGPCRRPA